MLTYPCVQQKATIIESILEKKNLKVREYESSLRIKVTKWWGWNQNLGALFLAQ